MSAWEAARRANFQFGSGMQRAPWYPRILATPCRSPGRHWLYTCGALLCLHFGSVAAQEPLPEYPVKAAFLYRLGQFVTWPPPAFPSTDAPFTLCIVGNDPFGPALDEVTRDQRIGERPILVQRLLAWSDEALGCQLLYVASPDAQAVMNLLVQLAGIPVLTVTDASQQDTVRGMVHFVIVERRVRFHIDEAAAARSNLAISSRILSLAESVRRRGQE